MNAFVCLFALVCPVGGQINAGLLANRDRQTDRSRDIQADRKTSRHTDGQTETERDRGDR